MKLIASIFRGIEEFVSDTFVYYYQSPVQPYQSVEFNLLTQTKQILKVETTPNYDASLYITKREYAKGHDGVDIPVTLVYKKATPIDGSAPCFVEGYGSYGSGGEAYFSPNKISLLDRGFVCVVTHVRGGSDRGYRWYLDGKLDKKKNTFFDFISTCEFLISRGYTSKGNIIASGASAGGLLIGAVANMRPLTSRRRRALLPGCLVLVIIYSFVRTSAPLEQTFKQVTACYLFTMARSFGLAPVVV